MTFLKNIELVIGNQAFVLIAIVVSALIKLLIIIFTLNQQVNNKKSQHIRFFLLAILVANIFSDISWIQHLLQNMSILVIDNTHIFKFIGRIAFGLVGMQYQCLALFLEKLITHKCQLNIRQKICCTITALFMFFPISAAFIYFNNPEPLSFLFIINRIALIYYILFLLPLSLFIVLRKLRSKSLPGILTKQLYIILYSLIIFHLVSDAIQVFPFRFNLITNNYPITGLSALFLTIGLLYCSRKIMGLRFLNLRPQVHAQPKPDFLIKFMNALQQLSAVESNRELPFITRNFFQDSLAIPQQTVNVYLRPSSSPYLDNKQYCNTHETVEQFINNSKSSTKDMLKELQALVYDEINFTNFYGKTAEHDTLLQFLTDINADIFVPIYFKAKGKEELIAYIIVERSARTKELYTSAEQQEIILFADALCNTINKLHGQNKEAYFEIFKLKQEKIHAQLEKETETLHKELYFRHQELNQFRECFHSFIYGNPRPVGIITYKNNRFTFINQDAKSLIPVDINTYVGHPLAKKIKQVTQQVATFRSPQTIFEKNKHNETVMLHILPHLDNPGNVIITASYADIPQLVKQKINILSNPNQWDYLLYLETTKAGRLINQLLPANSKIIFNFKIDLLKAAISKKAVLLDIADEDLLPMVELLHAISLREELYILDIKGKIDPVQMATKLFGINQLFGTEKETPLLKQLDSRGTLFIKDIHLLDLNCQEQLATFIHSGFYRPYKS